MRNESTLRNNDEKKSDIVSKFIEENFYKLKALDKIITEFKNELNSYNNHESKI